MPFGVIGVLLVILIILVAIFGLLSSLAGPVLAMGIFFFLACSFMILVVLIQRPKGGGLAGAFGGVGGAQQTAFGAKVGDVLTWVTVGFFVLFLSLAMGLTWKIKAEQQLAPPPGTTATTPTGGDAEPPGTVPEAPGPSDDAAGGAASPADQDSAGAAGGRSESGDEGE